MLTAECQHLLLDGTSYVVARLRVTRKLKLVREAFTTRRTHEDAVMNQMTRGLRRMYERTLTGVTLVARRPILVGRCRLRQPYPHGDVVVERLRRFVVAFAAVTMDLVEFVVRPYGVVHHSHVVSARAPQMVLPLA